jgi:hypothetical protein
MMGQMTSNYFKTFIRYSALIGIVGTWLLFIIGMAQTNLKLLDSRPLSYLGISSFAPYFKIGLIAGVCLMAVFYNYLQQTFMPSRAFKLTYFIGLLMQTIVALTPYRSNNTFQWLHWTAAIILALALVCAPWLFSASQNISSSAKRISRGVTKAYLIILLIETMFLLTLKYYVISELINLLIFDSWILYLTFLPRFEVSEKLV